MLLFFVSEINFITSFSCLVPLANSSAIGCSTEKTRAVTPKIVSGLVVKVEIVFLLPLILKSTSTPWLFPIQFFCIILTLSGQCSSFSISLSNWSAYFVILKNHCSSSFSVTSFLHLQHFPSSTCSFASTVPQLWHQFTTAFFLYAIFFS